MENISAIILTFNEEVHIKRCIDSVKQITDEIFVVDSFSNDKTVKISLENGAYVYQNKWSNSYSKQFNWALDNLPLKTVWVLRLDADEYISPELAVEINQKLPKCSNNITGVVLPFCRIFLGREIKYGTGGIKMLRLFRFKMAHCEQRWMDEHIQIMEGETIEFEHYFVDHNLNNLSWWSQKHIGYAIREAIDLLDIELGLADSKHTSAQLSEQAAAKRNKKLKYAKQPLFLRSFAYFIYRYIFKGGFLEGKEGFLWHFLQGWWYRTLVDAKIWEIKKACGNDVQEIKKYIKKEYSIDLL